MADIAGAIISALSCICGTPICNCIDQYRSFNDDVGELRRELDTLTKRKEDIESRIEVGEACGGEMVRREVKDWLKQVQDINVDVHAFLEEVQGIKWYERACLDKLVCRKIDVVREMLEKGSFPGGLFIDRAPARGNRIPTENLVGEISTKEEIWGYLIGDEVGMIGVCGIGGVGKTTIMKNLHNDLQGETRFQKVIWYLAICFLREITRVRNFEEVARLKKLETLECNFDDIQDFNSFVNKFKDFQRAITYSLLVGSAKDMLRRSKHELVITDCEIGEECIVLPTKLEDLWIIRLKNMGSSLSKIALLEKANELRTCNIRFCEEIECVVELDLSSSSSSLRCPVFDKLEELWLWQLPRLCELVRVEGEATPPHVFSNLKRLAILSCSGIRKLLPLELLQTLQNLEAITVSFCHQMEEIIASLDSDASSSDKFTFTFPKLRELRLWTSPQLKSICSAKGVMVCNSIETIEIGGCPELKRIPVQLPQLDNGQPSPPPHLREIKIHESSKEWWESVEWDHPNAKNLLQPFLKYSGYPWD
ncbi:hypothetical protein SLEP1_g40373 [Rubroshorea leprosula]|uniref:NB-ARC domain-containing protein n=1 Tax=Rubroshorea leprosula TaxID=152421 RepID=A0AAV5L3N5_9ROSI|nr:hypothetical protein SLEP1_g40373 [Rubroshorea leprosula]